MRDVARANEGRRDSMRRRVWAFDGSVVVVEKGAVLGDGNGKEEARRDKDGGRSCVRLLSVGEKVSPSSSLAS